MYHRGVEMKSLQELMQEQLPWGGVVVGLSSSGSSGCRGWTFSLGWGWVGSDVGGNWWIGIGVPRLAGDGGGDGAGG